MNACMELAGFSTSNKVKNHWTRRSGKTCIKGLQHASKVHATCRIGMSMQIHFFPSIKYTHMYIHIYVDVFSAVHKLPLIWSGLADMKLKNILAWLPCICITRRVLLYLFNFVQFKAVESYKKYIYMKNVYAIEI